MAFLNETGLERLWAQICTHFKKKGEEISFTLTVPTTGWTELTYWGNYCIAFPVEGITRDMDIYVKCVPGANFPIIGAICENDGELSILMSEVPTVPQDIEVTLRKEVN